jgi:hypothetical protein
MFILMQDSAETVVSADVEAGKRPTPRPHPRYEACADSSQGAQIRALIAACENVAPE